MIAFLRWTAVVLLVLFLIVWLGIGKLGWRAYAAVPKTRGEIALAGLQDGGYVIRDGRGVPNIFAASDHDAAFLTGFVHAQDRLWQMHVTRWYLRGQVAGVLGSAAVESDMEMRTYGLGEAADALAASMTPEELAPMAAYADGVNAALAARGFTPPLEFLMVGVKPEPWTPADSILVYKGLAFDLIAGDAFREAGRARLRESIGEEGLGQLLPPYSAEGPIALSAEELGLPLAGAEPEPVGEGSPTGDPPEGSNNWVVSGAHTASGLPLLANDPHLGLRTPGVWHLAAIHGPDGASVGVTIPGAPHVILGHNGAIAWGMTNTATDVADLFFRPEDAVTETREEIISVRFGGFRTITVRRTPEGPVLPAGLFSQADLAPPGQVAVLHWTLDDPQDRTATVGALMNRARNWDDFQDALSAFHVPMQNMVFAATNGDIGFTAPGYAPIRGADGTWTGPIPWDELPRTFNPADGVVVSANNLIVPEEYPYFLSRVWSEPYRARRITQLLAETDAHTPETFAAIQLDSVDLSAVETLPVLLQAEPATDAGRRGLEMLAGWDGDMAPDAAEPLIYAAWMKALTRAVYADELGADFGIAWAARAQFMQNVLTGPHSAWCDDVATGAVETCADLIGPALDQAMAGLEEEFGAEVADWRWGETHQAYFPHAPFSLFPVLDDIFSVHVPFPGSGASVNVGGFSYSRDDFRTTHAPSFRAIYDMSDLDASLFAMPVGQSGHRASPHYRDLVEPWSRGEYFTIPADWTPDAPPPGARILTLSPAG